LPPVFPKYQIAMLAAMLRKPKMKQILFKIFTVKLSFLFRLPGIRDLENILGNFSGYCQDQIFLVVGLDF
jgi:hypothetical protein